jgi:magnesium transporter
MLRFMKKMSKKVAQSPGTLVHIGEERTEKVKITVTSYDEATIEEKEIAQNEVEEPQKSAKHVTWINLDGVHDVEQIGKIGETFAIHPLIREDIVNTGHRPNMESFENHIFVVLKMLSYDREKNEVKIEQVSFILGTNYVLSFQEREGDVFEAVRERIRKTKGRIRQMGADFLFYALIDAIVDNYFVVLEGLGEQIEEVEDELVTDPRPEVQQTIHQLKREMIFIRRSVWPLRELVNGLIRDESPLIKKNTSVYLRDVYEHTIQVIETMETYRDMVSGMQDLYLSGISNKMNEVMKVLTIIATIFIPLTFIAGVYGMNFNPEVSLFNMPELNARFGYITVWAVMLVTAAAMVRYFKRKKWM